MRRTFTILILGLLLGLAPATALAKRSDFIGTWRNGDTTSDIWEIRVNSSYQVYVNKVTYAGVLVSYGTSGVPDGHTTATIVLKSGSKTTTLIIGIGTLLNNGADTSKMWCMKLVDLSNNNSDGNTHRYMAFNRYTLVPPQRPAAPQQELAP